MKRSTLTWALALSLLFGGLGIASTSRAADEGAQPAPSASAAANSGKHSSQKHHKHSKKKKSGEATQASTAGQPAK